MTVIGLLPAFVRSRIEGRPALARIFDSIFWLLFDKAWRMGVGFIVGVWLARYLGPEQYGLWNYSVAFSAIFIGIAALGLDGIVIRELVKAPDRRDEILGSAWFLKLIGSFVALCAACIGVAVMRPGEPMAFWLVTIATACCIFQSFNVIDFYFQSKVASKFTVYSTNSAFTLMAILKVYFLLAGTTLMAFALANLGEAILTALFLILAFHFNHCSLRTWSVNIRVICQLMRDAWPLLLAGMAVMIYMRIDAVMLQMMVGDREVGIYSAATRLSEIWYMLPTIIVSSVSPAIIKAHSQDEVLYLRRMRKLYCTMFWMAICVSLPMSLASNWIITFLFGQQYAAAAPVLAIHLWASIAVFLGVASSQHLVIEHLQKISLYRTLIGMLCNVALNFILIPQYGSIGAAIATVISYYISLLSLYLFKSTRSHAVLLMSSLAAAK